MRGESRAPAAGRKKMRRSERVDGAIVLIERIAGAILGLVTVLIVISSIGRYVFAKPVPDSFDLSRLILGVAIAWGLASVGYRGTHIKVDLVAQMVGPRLGRLINAFAWLLLLAFTLLMGWEILQRVLNTVAAGDTTAELRLPIWPFFAAIWLGLVAALFTTAVRLGLVVREGRDLGEFEATDFEQEQDDDKQ